METHKKRHITVTWSYITNGYRISLIIINGDVYLLCSYIPLYHKLNGNF